MCERLIDLQQTARLSNSMAADLFEVSLKTWDRYRYSDGRVPSAIYLHLETLVGRMPWQGWERFQVANGMLFPPGQRDGYKPETISGLFYIIKELEHRRSQDSRPAQYLLDF